MESLETLSLESLSLESKSATRQLLGPKRVRNPSTANPQPTLQSHRPELPEDHEEDEEHGEFSTQAGILERIQELYNQLSDVRAVDEEPEPAAGRVIMATRVLPVLVSRKSGASAGDRTAWDVKLASGKAAGSRMQTRAMGFEHFDRSVHWVGYPGVDCEPSEQFALRDALATSTRPFARRRRRLTLSGVFLDARTQVLYYEGFCRTVLWPLMHSNSPSSEYQIGSHNDEGLQADHSEERMWEAYVAVNQRYADAVRDAYEEGDVIWVHDYHLLLLPTMLRALLPEAAICFFLHVPFPSSEFFRILPYCSQLLRGLLGATLVGFQTFDYARHFLSAITRILGLECSPSGVSLYGHFVRVAICPIGVDPAPLERAVRSKAVERRIEELKKEFKGKTVLLGVDPMAEQAGLVHKLLAFEELLSTRPQLRGTIVLVQVAHGRGSIAIRRCVRNLVSRINGQFASVGDRGPVYLIDHAANISGRATVAKSPDAVAGSSSTAFSGRGGARSMAVSAGSSGHGAGVVATAAGDDAQASQTEHRGDGDSYEAEIDLVEVCALCGVASLCVTTSIRAGMCVWPSQYTACRAALRLAATIVLSEFAGAAHSLGGGALLVNPWDTAATAAALAHGISLPLSERSVRHRHLVEYVHKHTTSAWTTSFLGQLDTTHAEGHQPAYLRRLDARELRTAYDGARRRLVVLDYEGVLVPKVSIAELGAPSPQIMSWLHQLASDPKTVLLLVCCRQRAIVERWFGELPCILAAESGAFLRWPAPQQGANGGSAQAITTSIDSSSGEGDSVRVSSSIVGITSPLVSAPALYALAGPVAGSEGAAADIESGDSRWSALSGIVGGVDEHVRALCNLWRAARKDVIGLIEYYVERTPGSTIEDMEACVAWHYHDADPDHGEWQANNLLVSLGEYCNRLPITTATVGRTVLVRSPDFSKGLMLQSVLERVSPGSQHDSMVLAPPPSAASSTGSAPRNAVATTAAAVARAPPTSPNALLDDGEDDMATILSKQVAIEDVGADGLVGRAQPPRNPGIDLLVVLTSGEDRTDEDMFEALALAAEQSKAEDDDEDGAAAGGGGNDNNARRPALGGNGSTEPARFRVPQYVVTCTVGVKVTSAQAYVASIADVTPLIQAMCHSSGTTDAEGGSSSTRGEGGEPPSPKGLPQSVSVPAMLPSYGETAA